MAIVVFMRGSFTVGACPPAPEQPDTIDYEKW
jgi:hypothetical protein